MDLCPSVVDPAIALGRSLSTWQTGLVQCSLLQFFHYAIKLGGDRPELFGNFWSHAVLQVPNAHSRTEQPVDHSLKQGKVSLDERVQSDQLLALGQLVAPGHGEHDAVPIIDECRALRSVGIDLRRAERARSRADSEIDRTSLA